MGAGTGALAVTNITAGGNITVDAATFGGAIDITNMSASGAATVSIGSAGDFSAGQVNVNSTFTLDAAAATTGAITLTGLDAGNATISMGTGTGSITLTSGITTGSFTLDASTFGGAIDISNISASGAVVISMGTKWGC